MSQPTTFTSSTPRFGIPLLFAGQAQKEFFVNQAHAMMDFLAHPVVEGELVDPPADPADGRAWIVAEGATGDWSGYDNAIGYRAAEAWIFVMPVESMTVLDRAEGRNVRWSDGSWAGSGHVSQPDGGSVIDLEARGAIDGILAALEHHGILPAN